MSCMFVVNFFFFVVLGASSCIYTIFFVGGVFCVYVTVFVFVVCFVFVFVVFFFAECRLVWPECRLVRPSPQCSLSALVGCVLPRWSGAAESTSSGPTS